jgi:membrane protein required for colicin V production
MSGKINRWVCSSAFALEFLWDCDLKDLFLIDFAIRSSSGSPQPAGWCVPGHRTGRSASVGMFRLPFQVKQKTITYFKFELQSAVTLPVIDPSEKHLDSPESPVIIRAHSSPEEPVEAMTAGRSGHRKADRFAEDGFGRAANDPVASPPCGQMRSLRYSAMNPFDMIAVAILAFCVIRGIFRGLIKEVSSIVGVLAGFYAAYTYYGNLAGLLSGWISNESYLHIVSFLILFCLVFFVVSIIGVIIKYVLNIAFMGWFDRTCGAAFGLVKGILIVSMLFIIFTAFLPQGAPLVKDSVLAPRINRISEKMIKVVPKDMKNEFSAKVEELKKSWKIPQ